MKNLLKHFSLLMFFGAALLVIQGCGDGGDGNGNGNGPDPDPDPGAFDAFPEGQRATLMAIVGATPEATVWKQSGTMKSGSPTAANDGNVGTAWSGLQLTFTLDEANTQLDFTRTTAPTSTEIAGADLNKVWPASGSFDYAEDGSVVRATGETAVEVTHSSPTLTIKFTIPVAARVQGLPPAGTWTFTFTK